LKIVVRFVFCDWSHFVKTSVLARCWPRCLDMLVRYRSVSCFSFLEDLFKAWDLWRFFEDLIHVMCWPRSVCFLEVAEDGYAFCVS